MEFTTPFGAADQPSSPSASSNSSGSSSVVSCGLNDSRAGSQTSGSSLFGSSSYFFETSPVVLFTVSRSDSSTAAGSAQ